LEQKIFLYREQVHPNWIFIVVFVGANLIQSAFTGFCPAAMIMKACGMKATGCAPK
jgi:hypothetical protein